MQDDAEVTSPGALFNAGRLLDATAAANAAVKKAPTELGARLLLAELLVFGGNLERADVLLDACADLDPAAAVGVAEFRQLVRGEVARRQLFRDGRVPEFLGEPTPCQRAALAAIVALRDGNAAEAQRQAEAAEAGRVHPRGDHAGAPFDDFRDADDMLAGTVEVITTTGKYYWIPAERMRTIAFHAPKRPRDLYWRRATMDVQDGPEGEVYVPAIYAAGSDTLSEDLRMGRATEWLESGPVRGMGAVTLLVGEDAATMMELTTLTFHHE